MKVEKKIMAFIAVIAVAFAMIPVIPTISVFAADDTITDGGTISRGEYRLGNDITSPINIENGNYVTIDLNGHSIVTEGTAIKNKGSLKVLGEGKIENKASDNTPVILNDNSATTILRGGTFISNGTGAVITNHSEKSSRLRIQGGTYSGQILFDITSPEADVEIYDGTFLGNLNLNNAKILEGTFSSKVPQKFLEKSYGNTTNITENADGTFTYKIEEFYTIPSKTKVIYYGKSYKTDKLASGLDKKNNLIYIYKKKAYRVNKNGKKKLLSKTAKKLHTNFSTDYVDYIILKNGKKLKV